MLYNVAVARTVFVVNRSFVGCRVDIYTAYKFQRFMYCAQYAQYLRELCSVLETIIIHAD